MYKKISNHPAFDFAFNFRSLTGKIFNPPRCTFFIDKAFGVSAVETLLIRSTGIVMLRNDFAVCNLRLIRSIIIMAASTPTLLVYCSTEVSGGSIICDKGPLEYPITFNFDGTSIPSDFAYCIMATAVVSLHANTASG